MKTSFFLLTAALLLPTLGATAQSFTPDNQPAGGYHTTPAAPIQTACHTRQLAGGGSITYFEAANSCDPKHAQFAQLKQVFEADIPTVVLYEKPDIGVDSTEAATIQRKGESGYVRFLAQQYELPAKRLDDPTGEYEYLRSKFAPAPLKLFCLLREAQRFQATTGASKALTKKAMRQLLANSNVMLPGTEQVIHTLAELDAAYQTYCPGQGHWQDAPAAWFDANMPVASADNSLLAAINFAAGEHRRLEVYRTLVEAAQPGQRVLVVAAPGHVPADLMTPTVTPVVLAQ